MENIILIRSPADIKEISSDYLIKYEYDSVYIYRRLTVKERELLTEEEIAENIAENEYYYFNIEVRTVLEASVFIESCFNYIRKSNNIN